MLKTPLPTQVAIINYLRDALAKKSIKAKKDKARSGGLDHLRMDYQGDSGKLLNSIIPCSIGDTDVSASGSYETHTVIIKRPIPGIAKIGDGCYLVVTVKKAGSGILKTKQLNPNSLGLAGKTIMKSQFMRVVESAIASNKTIPSTMKTALDAVLDASAKPSGDVGTALNSISGSDLKVIEKDFGEMSGALWYMAVHDKSIKAIEFPSAANEALVDYYAIDAKNKKIGISAKGGAGAAPSLVSIAKILDKKTYHEPKKEAARKAIIAIANESIIGGVIASAKMIKAPGYEWLKKNMFKGRDFDATMIENALSHYKSYKALLHDLDGFYKANGHGAGENAASEAVAKRVFDGGKKRIGFIVGPLGYGVKDELNNDKVYVDVLNDATSSINVVQVYMNIKKVGQGYRTQYDVHGFKTADFKFSYQNSVGNLSNKISFKMNTKRA